MMSHSVQAMSDMLPEPCMSDHRRGVAFTYPAVMEQRVANGPVTTRDDAV